MKLKHTPGHPLPWDEGWNNRYFDDEQNGKVSMCARGPDSMVIRRDDPRFGELVSDRIYKDAAYIAHTANSYPKIIEALRKIAKPALGGKQQQYAAQALLKELGE